MSLRASVRRLGVVAVVCAVLVVAGCGGDEPTPEPKLPAEKTSSPEPEPEEELTDEELVEAFVREWNDELTRMQVSGETDGYRELVAGCSDCLETADLVDTTYANGGWIETGGLTLGALEIQVLGSRASVDVDVEVDETKLFPSANAEPEVIPGEETRILLQLRKRSGAWGVTMFAEYTS